MKTIILTDSCCDLPLQFIEDNSDILDTIEMIFNINGKDYFDDFGKTLSHDEFYKYLRNGIIPSTAQISSYRIMQKFKKHYDKGNSLIYLPLTSGLSGTYNNAVLARNSFLEENPDADITVIDTFSASVGQGILVIHAVEMLRDGISKDDVINWLEENKFKTNHWFAVKDLMYLKKGGRISSTTATVGTLLNVKPIIIVNDKGELRSYTNVRGRKKSLRFIFDKFKEHAVDIENTIVIIGHGNCLEDAYKLEQMIRSEFTPKKIVISELGSTIASHVGPDMIALAFVGNRRENK
ncbi:DegV domain-containing protein [Clostridium tepidiprofundi DSM 19306]|uniref:DegV domain-containing protein n=1 Tax=Clostridium tepidiprofundi DSM 19306 TaxID=1121338 RepID=A0A151B2U8_9CLOT|nr:DegV family protein [Clostridium tepidiprofundi]KYH33987.1 DegV domain-containing protein [Clostridium tepidiprofundi DSM 19306]